MAQLNQKELELIRLYALGEELSEQDTKKCQNLIETSEEARDELNKHDRFKVLMTQGKNHAVDSIFVDETMRRISTISQPPFPSSPTVLSDLLRIPAWLSPPRPGHQVCFFCNNRDTAYWILFFNPSKRNHCPCRRAKDHGAC